MNNLPAELQYRLAQLETCIQNQQNQSALLALEDLTRVLQRDYQQIQKAYLTLQQLHDSTQTQRVDLLPFLKDKNYAN